MKTSTSSWRNSLATAIENLRQPDRPSRIAVVGIGHELRGDDAVGLVIARSLLGRQLNCRPSVSLNLLEQQLNCCSNVSHPTVQLPDERDSVLVIAAGAAPENHTGVLRRFAPDLVLLVDAAQLDEAPGRVRWLAWQETSGLSASTHTLPPHLLAQYLTGELGCEVALIGIQPGDTTIGAPLSPEVQRAAAEIVETFRHSVEE